MENQEILKEETKTKKKSTREKINKKDLAIEVGRAFVFFLLGLLLGTREMTFGSIPLAYALLSSSIRQTPFVFLGILTSAFDGGNFSVVKIVGACAVITVRIVARLYLDKGEKIHKNISSISPIAQLFSEHIYLRVLSSALGVFFVGIWKIIEGGFRFYDLFGAIFYLLFTPTATWLFCHYFNINEQKIREQSAFSITPKSERLYNISSAMLVCAFLFSLDKITLLGMSAPIFFAVLFTLYATKRASFMALLQDFCSVCPSHQRTRRPLHSAPSRMPRFTSSHFLARGLPPALRGLYGASILAGFPLLLRIFLRFFLRQCYFVRRNESIFLMTLSAF